jgi:hypothetical protein
VTGEHRQIGLDEQRLSEFYHDNFVSDQVRDFGILLGSTIQKHDVIADVGGGCGYFAAAIRDKFDVHAIVLDSDPGSVSACRSAGIEAELFDAVAPRFRGDEDAATFNLVLHHLVGTSGAKTRALQTLALAAWRQHCRHVFVNEYIYESFLTPGLSAWLIWVVTSSRLLSSLASLVGRVIPSLRANTLGVGVRFRTAPDWKQVFENAGYAVLDHVRGQDEPVGAARRVLTIRTIRRDSFLLAPFGRGVK